MHVEPERVGAGHQQEGDWEEQHEDDFTWYFGVDRDIFVTL